MSKKVVAAGVVLLATSLPLVGAGSASAGDNEVRRSGSCSAHADWKLKAKPDDGRLEIEAEVDSNVNGQTWRWRFRHDGRIFAQGRSRTRAPSGSFSLERRPDNHAGVDHFRFRAVNRGTGEVCVGRLRI